MREPDTQWAGTIPISLENFPMKVDTFPKKLENFNVNT
jgi:hypothetical protein